MTTTTTNEVMPCPVLSRIIGRPTHAGVKLLHTQLIANACAVQSDRGDGRLGHLRIVVPGAEYQTLSHGNVVFPVPNKPVAPTHGATATMERMYKLDEA